MKTTNYMFEHRKTEKRESRAICTSLTHKNGEEQGEKVGDLGENKAR